MPRAAKTEMNPDLPTVLLVGCSEAFVQLSWELVARHGALVQTSTIEAVTTQAARWRPLAIVIPEHVYDFDPNEFEALARDVQGKVVLVADESATEVFERDLARAIKEATEKRA